jgi:Fur family ferric uptake transcriptional regulator
MPNFINILKDRNLKVTEQRVRVLEILYVNKHPLILNDLQNHLSDINRITLYRVLNDLETADLIRIFYSLEGQKYVEAKLPNHLHKANSDKVHLHFQCQKCDTVFCLDDVTIGGLPGGFNLHTDKTVLAGQCKLCS